MPLIRCTNVFYKGDYPVTQVNWYISQVSGERLQDHWSIGLGLWSRLCHDEITIGIYTSKTNIGPPPIGALKIDGLLVPPAAKLTRC